MLADLHAAMPSLWSSMSVINSFSITGLNPEMSSGEVLEQLLRTKRGKRVSVATKSKCRRNLASCIEHVKEHGRVTNEYLRTHFPEDVPPANPWKKDEDQLTLCQSQSTILTHAATVARRVTRAEFKNVHNTNSLSLSGLQCPSDTCQGGTCVCLEVQTVQRHKRQKQKQEIEEQKKRKKEEKQRKQEEQRTKREEVQRKKEDKKREKEEHQRKKQAKKKTRGGAAGEGQEKKKHREHRHQRR